MANPKLRPLHYSVDFYGVIRNYVPALNKKKLNKTVYEIKDLKNDRKKGCGV